MAKTEFLQIRCSPEDRERLERIAESEHLELSTWARRILLQAVERAELSRGSRLKVAEPEAPKFSAGRSRTPKGR